MYRSAGTWTVSVQTPESAFASGLPANGAGPSLRIVTWVAFGA